LIKFEKLIYILTENGFLNYKLRI